MSDYILCPRCNSDNVIRALNPLSKDHNEHKHCLDCDHRWVPFKTQKTKNRKGGE